MLVIDPAAMDRMAKHRRADFARRLLRTLEAQYPTLLGPLPRFVRTAMLCHGLDTAEHLGFTLESTMGEFLALQCASAPDFHQHPRVRAILAAHGLNESQRLARLHCDIDIDTWHAMRAGADLRAWLPTGDSLRPVRIAARVCSEFPALTHKVSPDELQSFFQSIPARARQHGISVESGMTVFAAALSWYGNTLDRVDGPAWACRLFFAHPPLTPQGLVAVLRQSLLMDSGRLV